MSIKRRLFKFVRSYTTMDFRMDHSAQILAAIKRKALRYQVLNHTGGYKADFGAESIREEVHIMSHALAYNL